MPLVACVALAGALLLLLAAARRAASKASLADVIRGHDLLPGLARYASWFSVLEGVAGLTLIGGWLLASDWLLAPAAIAVSVWYAVLAGYLAVLLRRRGRVPCGCLDDTSPVSAVKIARALLVAAASCAMLWIHPPQLTARFLYVASAAFVAVLLITADKVADLTAYKVVSEPR